MLPFACAMFGGTRAPLVQEFLGVANVTAETFVAAPSGAKTLIIECVGPGFGNGTMDDGSVYTAWWPGAGGGYGKRTVTAQPVNVRPGMASSNYLSYVSNIFNQQLCQGGNGFDGGEGQAIGGSWYGDTGFTGGNGGGLNGGGSAGPDGPGQSNGASGWPNDMGKGGVDRNDPNGKAPGGGCAVWWDVNIGPMFGTNAHGYIRLTWLF